MELKWKRNLFVESLGEFHFCFPHPLSRLPDLRFPIPEDETVFDDYNDLDGAGRTGLTYGEVYKYSAVAKGWSSSHDLLGIWTAIWTAQSGSHHDAQALTIHRGSRSPFVGPARNPCSSFRNPDQRASRRGPGV